MRLLILSGLVFGLSLLGCADSGGTPTDTGAGDTGGDTCVGDCSDGGPMDTGSGDTGSGDTGSGDTSGGDSGDGGGGGIVVDGVIGVDEWAGAASADNAVASGWGDANGLARLLGQVHGDSLHLAIEGRLEAGAENAIVVYVDQERGSGTGVADPLDLTDGDGALDNAVSAGISTPGDVQVDFAWGTKDFDRAQDGFDDRMGWRNVADTPGDFAWLDAAEAPTVCGATACETSIPLTSLGGTGEIVVFGRLVNTDGMMISNQCVPEDDPDMSGVVSVLLTVPR